MNKGENIRFIHNTEEVLTEPNSLIWNRVRVLILHVNESKEVPCFRILLENLMLFVFIIRRNEIANR